MKDVVVTGIGLVCPIGDSLDAALDAIASHRSGIVRMHDWSRYRGLQNLVAGPVPHALPSFPRREVRTAGRVAQLARIASDQALGQARLDSGLISGGSVGLSYGSTQGSTAEVEQFCRQLFSDDGFLGILGSSFPRFMSHTCAANLALHYGVRGTVLPVVSACTSGSQCIGAGIDAIRLGRQDVMICGGAEELHVIHGGVFDVLNAASTRYTETPQATPRPFDRERDGLVVGEGAATLVLESREHAEGRGARILAELAGYASNCDGEHIAAPSVAGMAQVMRLALRDGRVSASEVDYINAHATGTDLGDVAESHAAFEVFGGTVPISSLKGYMGHTLGACGALEAALCIGFLHRGFLPSSRNLEHLDPRCAALDYIKKEHRQRRVSLAMSNNFAFGGINTALLIRRA